MQAIKPDPQRRAIPLPEGIVEEDAVRRALERYAAAVRENAARPRDDKPQRREDEMLALVD